MDITNKSVKIYDKMYEDMWKRYTAYKKKHKSPFKVYTKPNQKGDYVWDWRFRDMIKRHDTWWVANKKHPIYVYTVYPSTKKKGPIQLAIEKKLGPFTVIKEFYNKMLGRGYGDYYNDVKTLKEELETLANLNCSDATQLFVLLAREMGYTAWFCHVYCTKSGSGHIYAIVKGKELGNNWIKVDMAACMSKKSKYPMGNVWCSDAKIASYNDPWLESDDGKV